MPVSALDLGRHLSVDDRDPGPVALGARGGGASAGGSSATGRPARARASPASRTRTSSRGGWVVPFPTIDPVTVLRSARALERYGPDFSYSHYAVAGPLPMLVGLGAAAGVAVVLRADPADAQAMLKLMSSGDGPSEEKRAKSWFRVRFAARAGDGATVRTEV